MIDDYDDPRIEHVRLWQTNHRKRMPRKWDIALENQTAYFINAIASKCHLAACWSFPRVQETRASQFGIESTWLFCAHAPYDSSFENARFSETQAKKESKNGAKRGRGRNDKEGREAIKRLPTKSIFVNLYLSLSDYIIRCIYVVWRYRYAISMCESYIQM